MVCFQVHLHAFKALLLTVTDRKTHTPADILYESTAGQLCVYVHAHVWKGKQGGFFSFL